MEKETLPHSPRYLPPYEDESISHYLGRWMRQPTVSISNASSLSTIEEDCFLCSYCCVLTDK